MSNQRSKMRLNPWYVPYAFANAEMTQYPLNCNIDPETGKIKPPGMRVYMADQADAQIERLRAALDYIVKRRLILGANGEFLERDTAPVAGYGGFYEHEQMAYVQPTLAEAISRATAEVSGWACANSHMFGADPTCPVCSSGETGVNAYSDEELIQIGKGLRETEVKPAESKSHPDPYSGWKKP